MFAANVCFHSQVIINFIQFSYTSTRGWWKIITWSPFRNTIKSHCSVELYLVDAFSRTTCCGRRFYWSQMDSFPIRNFLIAGNWIKSINSLRKCFIPFCRFFHQPLVCSWASLYPFCGMKMEFLTHSHQLD